jgi:cytochrome oxidase Cu insertion factor (SCO1/SenC/PrrC family)
VAKQYNIRYSKTSNLQVSTQYRKLQIPEQDHSQHQNHQAHQGHMPTANQHGSSSLYSHSTSIYLIDFQGRVRAVFDTTTAVNKVADAVRQLHKEEVQ